MAFALTVALIAPTASARQCDRIYNPDLTVADWALQLPFGSAEGQRVTSEEMKTRIWGLYESTYSKLGDLMFKTPEKLFSAYPEAIIVKHEGQLLGFLMLRKTAAGYKIGLAAAPPSRQTLVNFQKIIRTLNDQNGWYAETSGSTFELLAALKASPVSPDAVRTTLPNSILTFPNKTEQSDLTKWPQEMRPFVYKHSLKFDDKFVEIEKVMFGHPNMTVN